MSPLEDAVEQQLLWISYHHDFDFCPRQYGRTDCWCGLLNYNGLARSITDKSNYPHRPGYDKHGKKRKPKPPPELHNDGHT